MSEPSKRQMCAIDVSYQPYIIISFNDRRYLNSADVSRTMRAEWKASLNKDTPKVIVNLATLTELTSNIIGLFFWALEEVKTRKGFLAISNVSPMGKKLLNIAGAHKIIPIKDSVKEAMAWIDKKEKKLTDKTGLFRIFKRK